MRVPPGEESEEIITMLTSVQQSIYLEATFIDGIKADSNVRIDVDIGGEGGWKRLVCQCKCPLQIMRFLE